MEVTPRISTAILLLSFLIAAPGLLVARDVLAAGKPSPHVVIISPEDGTTTDQDSLAVEVEFQAGSSGSRKRDKPTGNVKSIILELNGEQVGSSNNPPNIKQGTHTFNVDISSYPDGPITFQAHGFQGNERAGLNGSSEPVTVFIDRTPPLPPGMARVFGTVGDDAADLVSGAVVSIHNDGNEIAQTLTDEQGAFEIVIPADGSPVSVVAAPPPPSSQGAATRVLEPLPGGSYNLHLVLWSEQPLAMLGDPDGVADTVVLSTPDSSVMVSDIPKTLNIVGGSARAFSPTFNADAFPGEFETRQEGLESGLISVGFVSVNLLQQDEEGNVVPITELRDEDGNPVWVELRFKIDRADWPVIQDGADFAHLPGYVDRPDRINAPLYYFDEVQGDWLLAEEFGWLEDVNGPIPPSALPAIQDGSHPHDIYMTGLVDHFTWYNLDYPARDACMTGRLIDTEDNPIPFSQVTIRSMPDGSVLPEGTAISFFSNVITTTTDDAGRFQVRVPRTENGPDDDWNNNGQVDTFGVHGVVDAGTVEFVSIGVFDNEASGYRTPSTPEEDGCGTFEPSTEDVVVELRRAKLVDFEITFLEEDTNAPLFVSPPSFTGPNHALATLLDPRIAIGGPLWRKTCETDTVLTACNYQSSTNDSGVAFITIPVLDRDDSGPLHMVEDLSGAFAYRKDRPGLGSGAYEFGSTNYLVPENTSSATIEVRVERRGPPEIEILQPDPESPLAFLFDDVVTLEATGTDANGESIDHLNQFYWSDPLQTHIVANGRIATVIAGTAFGSGTDHGVVAHGIDFWGWLGTASLAGIEVATVEVEVTPDSLALVPGDTELLSATVTGANDTSVIWTSSNLGIATVNSSGEVTAIAAGEADITARSAADPTKTATVTVEVEELVASFSVTPSFGDTTTEFSFDAGSSVGNIAQYGWDFGDGNSAGGETVTHTYDVPGTHDVTLTVTGASGAVAEATQSLPVGTTDPVASFISTPDSGNPPLEVVFDASASFHPDAPEGQIVSWDWSFGDGNTGTGENLAHTFTDSGEFTVELTVTDNDGATDSTTRLVQVNQAPTASFTVDPDSGPAPLAVTVNAAGSVDSDGQIERYSWDFGDGTVIEDGNVLEQHTYPEAGDYTITLTVEDDADLIDTADRTVEVAAPFISEFTAQILTSEPYLTYQFVASALSEPDGATIVGYTWDFGDGSPPVNQASPEVTHRYTSAGVFEVALTIEDSDGMGQPQTIELTVTPPQVSDGVAIAGGGFSHSVALRGDGTVWAWGGNGLGQLGDGTTTSSTVPVQVVDLDGVVDIAVGSRHSLALLSDGTVWAWGQNNSGQLGNGDSGGFSTFESPPVQVLGLDDVVAIAAGALHSLALRDDGTVWAWGNNGTSQLGLGTSSGSNTVPMQVVGLDDVIAISGGASHSMALRGDGTVWAWGNNNAGTLGDGTNTRRSSPVEVDSLDQVVAIAAGGEVSLALRSNGTVWAWGHNRFGQLGADPDLLVTSNVPLQVAGLTDITEISVGDFHALAVMDDGTVWGWGRNSDGSVSPAFENHSIIISPVQVPALEGAVSVAAGRERSNALLSDGSVWAWGNSLLGDGTTNRNPPAPVRVWWD